MQSSTASRQRESSGVDSLSTYLREISAYPLLTRDEEGVIARRIRDGDVSAIEPLVCANLRFVVSVARKYQHRGVSLSDLINEGNLGLMRAAEKFDDARGVRFISYAVWWIRQAVVQAVADYANTVRVPLGRVGMFARVGRITNALRQELGREPTQVELAAHLDRSEFAVVSTMPVVRSDQSLDAPVTSDDTSSLLDLLPDEGGASPDTAMLDNGLNESVHDALAGLRAREARVLKLYYGLETNDPQTLEDIGGMLGITRERVRQIKERALRRLRTAGAQNGLASFRE